MLNAIPDPPLLCEAAMLTASSGAPDIGLVMLAVGTALGRVPPHPCPNASPGPAAPSEAC